MPDDRSNIDTYRYIRCVMRSGYTWRWPEDGRTLEQQNYLDYVEVVRDLVDAGYRLKALLREMEQEIPKDRREERNRT